MLYGTREWRDYRLAADVTPHLARRVGIAARAQGMRRYYALLLNRDDQSLQLVRELDGTTVIAQTDFPWEFGEKYEMELRRIRRASGQRARSRSASASKSRSTPAAASTAALRSRTSSGSAPQNTNSGR